MKIKKWLALNLPLIHYFPMFSKNSIRKNVISMSSDIQSANNHTSLYLLSVKEKEKMWGDWLALKVHIRFKIELVYSIWKPVICKFNFSNSLNVQKSSQNVKIDSYREKGNPLFAFNVIKLVLLWRKLYYLIPFVIFWKCMLSKISGFLLMATMAVFFYFSIIIKHTER